MRCTWMEGVAVGNAAVPYSATVAPHSVYTGHTGGHAGTRAYHRARENGWGLSGLTAAVRNCVSRECALFVCACAALCYRQLLQYVYDFSSYREH